MNLLALLAMMLTVHWTVEGLQKQDDRAAHGRFLGQVKPVLYVSDLRASLEFFRDVLGFEFLSDWEGQESPIYAELSAGGVKFGLHAPTTEADQRRVGRQKLYFRVQDVDAHRKRILAWGVEAGAIRDTDWRWMFTVVDPDGHEIVFAATDPAQHSIDPW